MDVRYARAWKSGPRGEKRIEINASGLMKGQEDHQLLMETELLDHVDKKTEYPEIVRLNFISGA